MDNHLDKKCPILSNKAAIRMANHKIISITKYVIKRLNVTILRLLKVDDISYATYNGYLLDLLRLINDLYFNNIIV